MSWADPYQDVSQWMGWGGWMPFHGLLPLLVLVLVIVGLVALVRYLFTSGVHGRSRSSGLDILEERYAKGEMNRAEYLQKKRDLGG